MHIFRFVEELSLHFAREDNIICYCLLFIVDMFPALTIISVDHLMPYYVNQNADW